jgi:glucokinase
MKVAVGIDIGGTITKFVLASEDGKVLAGCNRPSPSLIDADHAKTGSLLVNALREFLEEEGSVSALSGTEGICGIGIGVAGLIDRSTGRVIKSPNIQAINGLPLKEIFVKEFSLPVAIENDANIYAYGEKWIGAGQEFDTFALLTLGTGLGGGLIYKGRLYEGPMEIGHMVVVPSGRYCTCGSCGCLESYASGRAIIERVVSSLEKGVDSLISKCCDGNFYKVTPKLVYQSALDGDDLSREVLREMGMFLGIGISNLINVMGVEAVIIGGGLVGAWDMFIEDIEKEVSRRAFKPLLENVKILKSVLTEDVGAVGAAGYLFSKINPS